MGFFCVDRKDDNGANHEPSWKDFLEVILGRQMIYIKVIISIMDILGLMIGYNKSAVFGYWTFKFTATQLFTSCCHQRRLLICPWCRRKGKTIVTLGKSNDTQRLSTLEQKQYHFHLPGREAAA